MGISKAEALAILTDNMVEIGDDGREPEVILDSLVRKGQIALPECIEIGSTIVPQPE